MSRPSTRPQRLAGLARACVRARGSNGRPYAVDGFVVDGIRETWLVEDRWWTDAPLRRRYWELVTTCGRNLVVFRDLERGAWYSQR